MLLFFNYVAEVEEICMLRTDINYGRKHKVGDNLCHKDLLKLCIYFLI